MNTNNPSVFPVGNPLQTVDKVPIGSEKAFYGYNIVV